MKINLTEAAVRKLESPAAGRLTIHDEKIRGLILVVTANGTKSYYLYRRVHGKPSRVHLGHHPTLTVDGAREAAVKKYAKIIDGANPNEEKRRARRGGITLQQVYDHFLENRVKARGSATTLQTTSSRFDTCLKNWKDRRLDSIRREEVAELHAQLGSKRGHVTANRAVQLLRSIFNHATDRMGITVVNPAARIELFRETPRERFLSADELPRFFAAVNAEPDELLRDFFLVALFTGARRSNVLAMRWADVDLERKVWNIPAAAFKTRKPTTIVLTDQALEILKRRKTLAVNEWVFPSHGKRGHLVEPKMAWERILERSGLKDLKIHDLRRTLGSWQAAAGSSLVVIGKSLGHTQPSTTAIYARLDLDAVRESVATATAAIAEAAKGKEGAK